MGGKSAIGVVSVAVLCGCGDPPVEVTGDPTQGDTRYYEQAEAVASLGKSDELTEVVTVAFNDRTQDPDDPKITYPDGGPSGIHRNLYHGASLMGWSYSVDNGAHFTYSEHRVSPPNGWAVIWGDPSLAASPSGFNVYFANLAGSDVVFNSDGPIVDASPTLDGFCVAKSINGGIDFQDVKCFKKGVCSNTGNPCTGDFPQCFVPAPIGGTPSFGTCNGAFYDGTSLATWGSDVFFAAKNCGPGMGCVGDNPFDVWRATGNTLDFSPLPDLHPFDNLATWNHPRLKVHGNRLYVVGTTEHGGVFWPTAASLDLTQGEAATWSPPLRIGANLYFGDVNIGDKVLRLANQFSYDVGQSENGEQTQLRVAYTRATGGGRLFIEYSVCALPLIESPDLPGFAQCSNETGWGGPNRNPNADEFSPELRVSGTPPRWRAIWKVNPSGVGAVAVYRGNLITSGGVNLLGAGQLVAPQQPCAFHIQGNQYYWGDYDDLLPLTPTPTGFQEAPHWLTPFTQNFGGCPFAGEWTAAMHVGAVTFDG